MQKDFPFKTVTTLIQICNKNVTDLLQECINFARISHLSGKESSLVNGIALLVVENPFVFGGK